MLQLLNLLLRANRFFLLTKPSPSFCLNPKCTNLKAELVLRFILNSDYLDPLSTIVIFFAYSSHTRLLRFKTPSDRSTASPVQLHSFLF